MGKKKKNGSSIKIYILALIGILFIAAGVLNLKYVHDQEQLAQDGNSGQTAENYSSADRIWVEGEPADSSINSTENTDSTGDAGNNGSTGNADQADNTENTDSDDDTGSAEDNLTADTKSDTDTESDSEADDPEITLVMIGDMLMHTSVINSGKQEDGTYNYDHLFKNVADQIEAADIAIVNQETIMGGDDLGFSGYPTFNSPTALADAEAAVGFDVILHGTNHCLDKGATALLNCIDYWETNYPDIAYLGINKSQEAQDNYLYIYEQDGISIAILNYTYSTNGISTPSDMPYLVNYLTDANKDKIISDIQRAQEEADFVIVCPHWGTEYNLGTDSQQEKWTKVFLEEGVDLVIGTHPHVIEPVEWVSDDEGNEMLVYYSLGNFVNGTSSSGDGVTNRMVGGMASVTIGLDEDGEAVITEYEAIPLVCHIADGTDFTVYYLSDYTEELAAQNKIVSQDSQFSLAKCLEVVSEVWGE